MRLTGLLFLFLGNTATATELPAEHFGHLPMVDQPAVSPDGEFVAVIVNNESGPTVSVAPFGTRELTPIIQLKYGRDRIEWIEWANDERLLISASESTLLQGDRIRVARLFSIDRNGKGLKEIKRKTAAETSWWTAFFSTTRVVSYLPDDPKHVLLQLYDELDEGFAVFKVNIYKNKFEKLFRNSYGVDAWYADRDGEVTLGVEYDNDTTTIWHRPDGEDKWQPLHSRKAFESETFSPFLLANDKAYVISDYDVGRQAVWRYDIPSGEFEELIFAADNYDVDRAILAPDTNELVGARHYANYRVDTYFDPEFQSSSQLVKASFPQYETSIVSRSSDRNRMVVWAVKDNSPPKYFWLDLGSKAGGFWYSKYPYLEQKPLANVEPFEFDASDGMRLNGYLTLPVNRGDAPAPLIVHPHGGPHARDYQYFDPWVQFMANRGYAVLQVNFRGSEGFNNNYEVSGYREWGQKMQQDVYDAIDFVAERPEVDGERACVVGASYGGYVALVAAFQRPTQFRCIVSIAGIGDLREHAAMSSRSGSYSAYITETIGDPTDSDDKRMLDNVSAVNHLAKIKSPMLLIHGTHDTQVRVSQSRDFHRKADKAGLDVEYLELEFGTHYFDEWENRIAVFQAIDSFLEKHL